MTTPFFSKAFLSNFWAKNKNSIWLASSLRMHRNLKTHSFPHKLKPSFIPSLSEMLCHPLKKCPLLKKGHFFLMKDLQQDDRQLLFEYYLSRHNYQAFTEGEGLLIDHTHRFHVLMNTTDHLVINVLDETNHLEDAWNRLLSIEYNLSKEIEFAFSPKYGFLTSDFRSCGTGLHVELFFHLPALIYTQQLASYFKEHLPKTISATSFQKDEEHFLGDLVVLSNLQTLAISEETLIKNMHTHALNLIIAEQKTRDQIKKDSFADLKSKISKAFGSLKHAYQLNAMEAFELLSLCKFGVELEIINHVSLEKINELFFSSRKAILALHSEDHSIDLAEHRASYIKQALKKASV